MLSEIENSLQKIESRKDVAFPMPDISFDIGQSVKSDTEIYYKILQFLGRGANAYAYRCLCTRGHNSGIEFALKIQYNLSTERRRERFLRESEFLQSADHPAILKHYDGGTFNALQEHFPFIITSYMPETLATRMRRDITYTSKIKYSCHLASAIVFLKVANTVHRDIKPNNIFISNDNAMLGDFGLIKRIESNQLQATEDDVNLVRETVMNNMSGYVAMARYYRTPELVNYANRMDELRIESDVFQLGLVLTELFTGNNPLEPSDDIRSPIVLKEIDYISGQYGGTIKRTLSNMITIDYRDRVSAEEALSSFIKVYSNIQQSLDIA